MEISLSPYNAIKKNIEIAIQDNGCGIPKDIMPKVTSEGFSFNKKMGTGFGLYFAKKHIEQLHGQLLIDSKEGIGTTITIKLLRSGMLNKSNNKNRNHNDPTT